MPGLPWWDIFWLGRRRRDSRTMPPAEPSVAPPTLVPGAPVERRQFPRRWGNPVLVHFSFAEAEGESFEALILNRSRGGPCLSVSDMVAVGAILNVRTTTAPNAIPCVQVEVKYCIPFFTRWKVGCRFVQPPAEEVFLLFG